MPTLADLQALEGQTKKPTLADLQALESQPDRLTPNDNGDNGPSFMSGLGRAAGTAGRALIKGAATLPAMATDTILAPLYQMAGKPYAPTMNSIDQLLTKVGVPEPQTATERVFGDMESALGGVGGANAMASLASKGGSAISKMIMPISSTTQTQAALGASGASGITRESGGSPLAQIGAGLVGSIAAPAAIQNIAPGIKNVGSDIFKGIGARGPEELQESVSNLRDTSVSPLYKQMRNMDDKLTPDANLGLVQNIRTAISSSENKFIPQLNPKTVSILDAMEEDAKNGKLGVSDIDQYRRLFSRVGGSEDGFSAGVAKSALDKYLNNLNPEMDLASGSDKSISLLNQARGNAAATFRYETVADILSKANGDPNKIKSMLSNFVNNEDNLIGFNDAEKEALRRAAETGVMGNFAKGIGKFGIDFSKSGTGNIVLPFLAGFAKAGGSSLVPGGLPIMAAVTALRQGQKYAVRGASEKALDLIKERIK